MVQLGQRVMVVVMAGYIGLVLASFIISLIIAWWWVIAIIGVAGVGGILWLRWHGRKSSTFLPF